MANEVSDFMWAKLIATTLIIALGMVILGTTACDIRDRQQLRDMAERGYCRINGVWMPCTQFIKATP